MISMASHFLILHGWQNHRPPAHWQHWRADRLGGLGHRVTYPQLPEPDDPSLEVWLSELGRCLDGMDGEERVVLEFYRAHRDEYEVIAGASRAWHDGGEAIPIPAEQRQGARNHCICHRNDLRGRVCPWDTRPCYRLARCASTAWTLVSMAFVTPGR